MRIIPVFIFVIATSLLLINCKKEKLTTTPKLVFKSASNNVISGDQVLQLKLDLSDKEGDFTTYLGVKKSVKGCPASEFTDSSLFSIPTDFIDAKENDGELVITLTSSNRLRNACSLPGGATRPDTTVFSFWTKDKAGNVSDTARSTTIIFLD